MSYARESPLNQRVPPARTERGAYSAFLAGSLLCPNAAVRHCSGRLANQGETFVSAVVPFAGRFKGNSGKGLNKCGMITEAEKSAASEVRHRHREIDSRVNKFAQNLHVLEMAVEAVEEGLDPCSKRVCLFAVHRPGGKACYVAQCVFVLQ
jgi:hypothetical protein